jgi:NAD(P)-dependent dehydrogenase (short-subunit alcohol dehydrogenase family)
MSPIVVAAGVAAVGALLRRRRRELRGRVVVITGGSRGLGVILAREFLAREFARHGARLALCARTAADLARAAEALAPAEVLTRPCDVGDPQQVRDFLADVLEHYGQIDVLVNNAGIIEVGPLEAMSAESFRRAHDVMFWGMLHATLAVLPHMRARRQGSIVNVTSIGGKVSIPHLLPYCTAKFAAVGLSEGLRPELARDGVDVVTVVPGLMRTGSHLNAEFVGRQKAEFRWFALGASAPLVSMDAERAARQIVAAVRRGEAERILSIPSIGSSRAPGPAGDPRGAGTSRPARASPSSARSPASAGPRRSASSTGRGRASRAHASQASLQGSYVPKFQRWPSGSRHE